MDGGRSGWGLEGHGVIVTGAAQGIGEATARALADVGARVCAVDLSHDDVRTVVDSLPGGPHQAMGMDINDLAAHAGLVQGAADTLGDLHAIVLAAGVLRREPFEEVTEEAWDWQLDTNLKATFFLSRAAGQHMRESATKGSICTFTSISATMGGVSSAPAYGASKGGVIALTYAMARHYGPFGIRVNSIAPGFIDTPMQRAGFSPAAQAYIDSTPLARQADAAEVASVAVFLASAHASFITGAIMNVSGGGWMG
ncbi:MAG TPA: SDR family NAD(P)-dependent oxidoreductase [Candidatus Limnocylindrales bacterium]|nr:SDR family NAD(P)-dependent oxidoreductase [Candidatus Limnocylindrales bacterium]